MKLIECVNAYVASEGMARKELDFTTAHAIVILRKNLKPHVGFYCAEELKLVKRHSLKDDAGETVWNADRTFQFRSQEAAEEFEKARRKLGNVIVEESWTKLKVPTPERITPAQLEALQRFLEFGGDEDER